MSKAFLALIIVCCIEASTAFCDGPDASQIPQLETLREALRAELVGQMSHVELPGNITAKTIVFRETRWELKTVPQSGELTEKWYKDAMALPEEKRLEKMNKVENHAQVWLVPIQKDAATYTPLEESIPPNKQPHELYREMAFIGEGHEYAWFAYTTIWQWVHLQKSLDLKNGADHIAAAIRGVTIEDYRSWTRSACLGILGRAGPDAIPYIEKAIEDGHPVRHNLVRYMSYSEDPKVTEWLIRQTDSEDERVSSGARAALRERPRKEAAPLYKLWLSQGAGKENVIRLMVICQKLKVPGFEDILPLVLKSPTDVYEYRFAFEFQREFKGNPVPDVLLENEMTIRKFGNASGKDYDQDKVDAAVERILASDDLDAVAAIGASLAIYITKGDSRPINDAGIRILRELPDGKGADLISHLVRSCRGLDFQKERLIQVEEILTHHGQQ